jgi:hypothetical protein
MRKKKIDIAAELEKVFGGYDTVLTREEFEKLYGTQQLLLEKQ